MISLEPTRGPSQTYNLLSFIRNLVAGARNHLDLQLARMLSANVSGNWLSK